jgi:demethoxyubiquinone hydroxylase (CLK1/Coq7/Cat5 family)
MNAKNPSLETATMTTDPQGAKALHLLQSLYRGELSAVETYERALGLATLTGLVADVLRVCQGSHQKRVTLLKARLVELGAEVPASSGVWGAMANVLEAAAVTVGEKAAIGVLEEGEDVGLDDYQKGVDVLGPDDRQLVRDELLPAQQDTHRQMSNLKQAITDGA